MWILAPPLLPPTSRSTGDWRGHLGKADCWISWSHWDTGLSATGHLQSQHLTFHAPHQLLHLFPVHLTVTTCQSLHSPWGTFHVLTIMFNFWIHSTSCSVTTVSDFHIPGRYLSHPTECQLGICQGNSEEHQVFFGTSWHGWELAHGLVKIHESEELRGSLWGRGETISFDQGLAHRSCTNLSYQRCGRRQLISKAAQIEGVFMLFRHLQHCYGD